MKNICFALLGLLFLSACSKDEPYVCDNTNLATTILGPWEAKIIASNGDIEFLADGTLIDPSDAISGGSINDRPLVERTYRIIGDTLLEVESATGDGYASLTFEFPVMSYTCDEIILEAYGFAGKFVR